MTSDLRRRLESADHGVLSTLHPERGVDAVPVCFAIEGDLVGIPIDIVKAKRSTNLGRLRNLERDPRATLLVEQWDRDDWSQLWWVRASLEHRTLEHATPDSAAHERLVALLEQKYPQYTEGTIESLILLTIVDLAGWSAT
jgi:PPOX class probable F420-dependent enzyme